MSYAPMSAPVILMRPGEANHRLSQTLKRELGIDAWEWPAFDIQYPDQAGQDLLRERLRDLSDVEMVVLPSPASVAAVAHWIDVWPEHITLAAVGEGTARVIRAAWGPNVKLLSPPCDAEHSGSEALWEMIRHRGAPSRVLFLRGQTGREYLPQKFREMGTDVVTMCAYVRVPIELSTEQKRELQKAIIGPAPIVYVTSSDAVDALFRAIRVVPKARQWLTNGVALTIHPRITTRLKEAGFSRLEVCPTDDASLVEAIKTHMNTTW